MTVFFFSKTIFTTKIELGWVLPTATDLLLATVKIWGWKAIEGEFEVEEVKHIHERKV